MRKLLQHSLLLTLLVLFGVNPHVWANINVTAQEAKDLIDSTPDIIIVDIRPPSHFCGEGGHIPGAVNYPTGGYFQANYTDFPIDATILIYCEWWLPSEQASSILDDAGYLNVYDFYKGMPGWLWETEDCICEDDNDCPNDTLYCNGELICDIGICVEVAAPCSQDQVCDETADICVECLTDNDCGGTTPYCTDTVCVECQTAVDCPDDTLYCNSEPMCDIGTCVEGTAPCSQDQVCDETADICVECLTDNDCAEDYACVDNACELANDPPIFLTEPRWPYGYWPILSSDPENPHAPQSENLLFFAYDDDGVGCQTAPDLNWMYRPVALQEGGSVLPLGDWTIEVPSWSFMFWVMIEEPTIAETTGLGLFEFKMSVTDCLGQTTDSEGFYGKRYYFQVE